MKFATVVLLGILLLAPSTSLNAQAPGSSQVVAAYINENYSPMPPTADGFDGICLVYYTMLGDLDLAAMFSLDANHQPVVDAKHARFIWVSDYKAQYVAENEAFSFFLILEGTATIYYKEQPETRDWKDRSTWGEPVATFVRKTGMFQSPDGGNAGTFVNTAQLVSSKPVQIVTAKSSQWPFPRSTFNLKDVIPQGMSCFESINGFYEAGSCVSVK